MRGGGLGGLAGRGGDREKAGEQEGSSLVGAFVGRRGMWYWLSVSRNSVRECGVLIADRVRGWDLLRYARHPPPLVSRLSSHLFRCPSVLSPCSVVKFCEIGVRVPVQLRSRSLTVEGALVVVDLPLQCIALSTTNVSSERSLAVTPFPPLRNNRVRCPNGRTLPSNLTKLLPALPPECGVQRLC